MPSGPSYSARMSRNNDAPLMASISGVRGISGITMTPGVAARYATAFARFLRTKRTGERPPRVIVARDGRAGGRELLGAAARALQDEGCEVADMDVAMTPSVGVGVDALSADGALIITASHNPQEWNGIKPLLRETGLDDSRVDACAPAPDKARDILAAFEATEEPTPGRPTTILDATKNRSHIGVVMDLLGWLGSPVFFASGNEGDDPVPVVLDSVNASGRVIAAEFFEFISGRILGGQVLDRSRLELVHLNAEESGVFPHTPEPTRDNLTELCEQVVAHRAAVGFAQDPDADRLAVIDETGRYIGEEYTLVLCARALFDLGLPDEEDGGERVLVANLSTSRMIDDLAAEHGARVVRTPVGEANVVEAMKRERDGGANVVLGGEGNGGVIHPRVTYVRDSLTAMALVLGLMAHHKRPLSELVDEMPSYSIVKRKTDLARREDAQPVLDALPGAFPGAQVDTQDGVRLDLVDRRAWLHVRPSNTEPILRLIAEAPDEATASDLLDRAEGLVSGG